jgi:hypothetical protein
MVPLGTTTHGEPFVPSATLRHRRVPCRAVGDKLIVARPRDGAPVILDGNAVVVWRAMDDWTTTGEIDLRLTRAFPGVAEDERVRVRTEIVQTMQHDDLVELIDSR